jgi:hypothetical protein
MSKWKSRFVLGLAVLLTVACSKNESGNDATGRHRARERLLRDTSAAWRS